MPSEAEISQMDRLKAIMEGKSPSTASRSNSNRPATDLPVEKNINDDMKEILTRMYRSSNSNQIQESKTHIPEITNQQQNIPIQQNIVENRVKRNLNETRIVVELYPDSNIRKLYSLIYMDGSSTTYTDLNLFETASLIKEMIYHGDLNQLKINEYLEKDKDYNSCIKEYTFFKSKAKRAQQINEHEAKNNLEIKSKTALDKADKIVKDLRKEIKLY